MVEPKPAELPRECWELIANSLDQNRNFESLSLVSTQFLSVTGHLRRSLTITSRTAPSLSLLPNGSLDLQYFVTFVSDEGIADLSLKLTNLQRVDISGNQFITDKSLSSLSFNCSSLVNIILLDCDFITQTGIGVALRNAVNLTSVLMDGIGIPSLDSSLKESFVYAKNLAALHLSNSFLSDEFLSLIADANLPLKDLTFSHCYNITCVGVEVLLHRYRFLVYLDLEGANFLTDESMIELSNFLQNLSFLNLGLCSKLTGLTFFTLMNNCPLLEDVKMESTNIGVEEFTGLTVKESKIKLLDLAGNNSLSDECLKRVASSCPDLEVLNLSYCPNITEDGVTEVLRKCIRVRHLEISRCVGIASLTINFELPKLEVLKAQGSILDDEALGTIAERCKGILHLDLESCLSVSKEGLGRVVENCRRLREINLRCCENVDINTVALMAFKRPSLRKIIPPGENMLTDKQIKLFLRHGCSVSES
ncbi:F-box/LRR-repeat protein 2 [Linum grandiflorum]